jgi:ATPase
MRSIDKIVPDTSILIEALTSKFLLLGELTTKHIIIHNATIDELEQQANKGRETGYLGLEEIKRVRELCSERNIKLEFKGPQPGEFEIRHAKDGAIDDMIRTLAQEEQATLFTADRVQSLVADAQGIPTYYIQFDVAIRTDTPLDEFFTDQAMSVHLKEDAQSVRKVGRPGAWEFEPIPRTLSRGDVQRIAKQLVEIAGARKDSYIEQERAGSIIMQIARYRIVVAKPPFASAWEITAVRPVTQLTLDDYKLSAKLQNRLAEKAEGVLVAGAPGSGKSTFVQAVAAFYVTKNKIVKTVEAPRDLVVPKEVTQYSLSNSTAEEIRDVLLLNRPDYTIFDEMRNTHHFQLFADLRLAGVGMLGVVHATKAVDAIQRFLGRIELGVIPHIIDTVIFIQAGGPKKVFTIDMEVKVPSGMMEADLARPVVCIYDFESEKLEYEVYTFGEQTVVMPVSGAEASNPTLKLAAQSIKEYFYRYADKVVVEMMGANKAVVFVPKHAMAAVIGTGGKNIQETEKLLGISIDIREFGEYKGDAEGKKGKKEAPALYTQPPVPYDLDVSKKGIVLELSRQWAGKDVDLYDKDEFLLTATVNKKGLIKLSPDNGPGSAVARAAKHGKLEIRG